MAEVAQPPNAGETPNGKAKATRPKKPKPKNAAAKRNAQKAARKQKNSAATGRLPWTFPKHTLEDAIRVAKAIEDKNAGNPMPAASVATAVGYKQVQDWRFLELLRSANQYGLVDGTGPTAKISLAKLGQDIVAPSSPQQRTEGLFAAFRHVKDFDEVEKFYGGKAIPEDEFFLNTLTREFTIPRDRAETFAKVFTTNLTYLRSFAAGLPTSSVAERQVEAATGTTTTTLPAPPEKIPGPAVIKEPRGREFLETCFVMMPFGEWFDRYYQEIYIPAIREAGFEPVRADELFTTGSVVEQIWEEIVKAKLLLADLSGKNPNVFYELGLAHAAVKPVVFTASKVDDVPFDLRHLRVIIYEIQVPDWGARLRKSITDYLRNAAKEPEKSIPHPFRSIAEGRDAGDTKPPKRRP
jgi:hypothetical protein